MVVRTDDLVVQRGALGLEPLLALLRGAQRTEQCLVLVPKALQRLVPHQLPQHLCASRQGRGSASGEGWGVGLRLTLEVGRQRLCRRTLRKGAAGSRG